MSQVLTSREAAFYVLGSEHFELFKQWLANSPQLTSGHAADWQQCNQEIAECGTGELPKPRAYKQFYRWLRAQGHLYPPHEDPFEPPPTLRLATSCRHALHPCFTAAGVDACPVCAVQQLTGALERIYNVWTIVGGPSRTTGGDEDARIYTILMNLWRVEKTRWANLVARLQEARDEEEAWATGQMEEPQFTAEELSHVRSCKKALQLAWAQNTSAIGHDALFVPGTPSTRPSTPAQSRSPELGSASVPSSSPPMALPEAQPNSPPLPPSLNPLFPPPNISDSKRHDSSCYQPSEAPPRSPSLPQTAPLGSTFSSSPPLVERKRATFADDVEEYPKRHMLFWYRRSAHYLGNGRHVAPDDAEWVDTSFKRDEEYWDREGVGQAEKSEDEEESEWETSDQEDDVENEIEEEQEADDPSRKSLSTSQLDLKADFFDSDLDAQLGDISDDTGHQNLNTTDSKAEGDEFEAEMWSAITQIWYPSTRSPQVASSPSSAADDDMPSDGENLEVQIVSARAQALDPTRSLTATDEGSADTETSGAGKRSEQDPEGGDIGLQELIHSD